MVQEKTVLVGYACSLHSGRRSGTIDGSQHMHPFSGDGEVHFAFQLR